MQTQPIKETLAINMIIVIIHRVLKGFLLCERAKT